MDSSGSTGIPRYLFRVHMILLINRATSSTLALLLELSEVLEDCPEIRFQILAQFNQSTSLNTAFCLLRYLRFLR